MKKTVSIILMITTMCLMLCSCGMSAKMEIGKPVKKGITQVTLQEIVMDDTNYVRAEKNLDNFLDPVKKDDLKLNERFIKADDSEKAPVVATMIVENVGKNDLNVGATFFKLNYDDGNKYYADCLYAKDENGLWQEYKDGLELEKVTSGPAEIKVIFWVPNVVVNGTASLVFDFQGAEYEIR